MNPTLISILKNERTNSGLVNPWGVPLTEDRTHVLLKVRVRNDVLDGGRVQVDDKSGEEGTIMCPRRHSLHRLRRLEDLPILYLRRRLRAQRRRH